MCKKKKRLFILYITKIVGKSKLKLNSIEVHFTSISKTRFTPPQKWEKKHSKNDNLNSPEYNFSIYSFFLLIATNRMKKKTAHLATLEWNHKILTRTLRYVAFQFLTDANPIIVLDDLPLCTKLTNLPRQISRFCDKHNTELDATKAHAHAHISIFQKQNIPTL